MKEIFYSWEVGCELAVERDIVDSLEKPLAVSQKDSVLVSWGYHKKIP